MKAAKLLREGCRTAANLLRPRMDMTEGFETLESLWPDTKGECYVDRPADWLTPEKPVALSVIIPAYNLYMRSHLAVSFRGSCLR